MLLKPNAHTILSLLLKFLSDLCSCGCKQKKKMGEKKQKHDRHTVQVAPCPFPVAVMWTKMNVFYWCVALALFDGSSGPWKSAVCSCGLVTSLVRAVVVCHYRERVTPRCPFELSSTLLLGS